MRAHATVVHVLISLAMVAGPAAAAERAAAPQEKRLSSVAHATPVPDAQSLANRADSYLRGAEELPPSDRAIVLYRRALALAEQSLALDPASARGNFVYFAAKGRILMIEGAARNVLELKKLRPYLDRALEADPEYVDALAAKGGMLLELPKYLGGDPVQAEQILRRAVELNPPGPSTRYLYARALLENGKLSAAREQLRRTAHYATLQRRYLVLVDTHKLTEKVDSEIARSTSR